MKTVHRNETMSNVCFEDEYKGHLFEYCKFYSCYFEVDAAKFFNCIFRDCYLFIKNKDDEFVKCHFPNSVAMY